MTPANPRPGDALSFVLPSGTTGLAGEIRKAIGADASAVIRCSTPQFARPFGWPDPAAAPDGWAEFTALFSLTVKQLQTLGCEEYEGRVMLFPGEWYGDIPEGFPVTGLNGRTYPFKIGVTSSDTRYGFLGYGIPMANTEAPHG